MPTDESSNEVEQLREQVSGLKAQLAEAQAQTREAKAQAAEAHRSGAAQGAAARGAKPGQPGQPGQPVRGKRRWRTPVAVVLIVLGCLLAPVAVVSVWGATQLNDTPRYVANVQPLISQPAVQSALTNKITVELTRQINVPAIESKVQKELAANGMTTLSGLIGNFSGPIASGVNGAIHSAVGAVVSSKLVAKLWTQANTLAHTALVQALSGNPNSAVTISNGQVVIALGPIINQVEADLAARGFTVVNSLPTINPTFPLFSAKYLIQARSVYNLLNTLAWVIPLLTLLLLAGGIYLARGHRRALVGAGIGVAASMVLLAIALAIGRSVYLNSVPASVMPADAAAAVFDTLVRFVQQDLWVLIVVGLTVALAGFFAGPSVTAVRTRNGSKAGLGRIRDGAERGGAGTGAVGDWVYRDRRLLRILAVIGAVAALVFWSYPTPLVALSIALILLVVIGLIELIGRPPAPAGAGPAGRPAGQPAMAGAGRPGGGPSGSQGGPSRDGQTRQR